MSLDLEVLVRLRIRSGCQTGADQAGLDVALELGFPVGGWAPKGWRREGGKIPEKYRKWMQETPSANYEQRTEWNVRDSDATLILHASPENLTGGTALTYSLADKMGKSPHVVNVGRYYPDDVEACREWFRRFEPAYINIAGPRESKQPGIYGHCRHFLLEVFSC